MSRVTREALLGNVDVNILNSFTYPANITINILKKFEEMANQLTRYKTQFFTEIYEDFVKKMESEFVYYNRRDILIRKFIEAIKTIFVKKKLPIRSKKYSFDFPVIEKTYRKSNIIILAEQAIRNLSTITISTGKSTDPMLIVEVFREIFQSLTLSNIEVADIFKMLNDIFEYSFKLLSEYFIEDILHTTHLDDAITFQNRTKTILDNINEGALDTTRQITQYLLAIIQFLGIQKKDIEYLFNGKKLTTGQITDAWAYPTTIFLPKKPKYFTESGVLKRIKDEIENYFKSHAITFSVSKNGMDFTNISTTTKSDLEYQLQMAISLQLPVSQVLRMQAIRPAPKFTINLNDFINIKGKDAFSLKSIDEVFKSIEKQVLLSIYIETDKTGKKVYEEIPIMSCSFSASTIEFKIFDLIEYYQQLAWDIHKFFAETMDLKAITQKKKYHEKWDGSRGFLNIDKTIEASVNRGYIYPIQTYRKKLVETPPTIFLVYDISGSMGGVHKLTQFLVIIVLSFFEKDINKFFTGYITTAGRGSGYSHLFRSETENRSEDLKKKQMYDVGTHGQFYIVQQESRKRISNQNLGEVSNDYYDYDKAIRDFLDLAVLGGGTNFDVYNLVPRHPDIDARGLKYVFCVTDANFTNTQDKIDFVRVSRDLVQRDDVRFFFLWIMWSKTVNDHMNYIATNNEARHFVTKQAIARKIDELVRNPNGSPKSESSINFPDLEFYLFVYDHFDKCHLVLAENLQFVGEVKNILHKLSAQEFFVQ